MGGDKQATDRLPSRYRYRELSAHFILDDELTSLPVAVKDFANFLSGPFDRWAAEPRQIPEPT